MAQSYTRQSTFADGDTITASLFNNEYNQLLNAFAYSSSSESTTGHRHDGTAAQGGNIPQIGDLDFNNKIVVDSTNNRWGVYVEVSGSAVEQIRIQDGAIVPVTDNDIDLGTSALEFKDLFINGTAHVDTLDVDVNATVAGTLGVTGATTLSSTLQATTITATTAFVPDASDGASLGTVSLEFSDLFLADGALIAFGNDQDVTITHLADAGLLLNDARGLFFNDTTQYINAPNGTTLDIAATDEIELNATLIDINGAVDISGNLDIGGNLVVTGTTTFNGGTLTMGDAATDNVVFGADINSNIIPNTDDTYDLGSSSQEWRNLYIDGTANIDSLVADTADINGGTIDGATIATSDITVGAGKTLNVSAGTLTLADNQISGDKVEGGTIAATTITDLTFGSLNDGVITVTAFVDEDDMSSDSATLVPTQQSVKAYVDSQVTAQDLDFQGDTGGALSIDLDSESLTIAGGTGLDTVGLGNTVTVNIDSTVATLTGTQTLTNKTLTSPIISSISNTGTVTLPTSTDTLVGRATTDTLTNKTLTSPVINTGVSGTAFLDDDTFATASATTLASSESIKAYVDTRILTEDTLAEMNDVNITAPADGALLFYDSGTSMWIDNVVSGDITIADTGVAAISSGVIVNDDINASAAISISKTALVDGTGLTLTGDTLSVDAAQTQITSVGTLGSLTVSGDVTVDTNTLKVDSTNNRVGILNATPDVSLDIGSATDAVHVPVGTTAQRPGSPAAGYFRYNTSLAQFEGYTDAWGAIGGGGTNTFTHDVFTCNGSTTDFTLSQSTESENNLIVFIDGVFQEQGAYSIATAAGVTTLTMSAAPANGRKLVVYTVAAGVSGSNLNIDTMTGDGSDTTLTLSINPVNENNTQVFIDGVYQSKANYSISGTTLTFSTAPPTGSAVEVMTMTQTEVNVPVDGTITSAKLSGDLTLPGDLSFADNKKAIFGAGSDLQIYHDASHSYIVDAGTGNMYISTNGNGIVMQASLSETMFSALPNGSVRLYYDNAEKLSTTATGIDVTGSVTASGIDINGAAPYIKFLDTSGDAYAKIDADSPDEGTIRIQADPGNAGANSIIRFDVDGSERMRIAASGNVGIGSASPSSTFRASINGDGSSVIGGIEFRNAAAGGSTFTIGHASATSPSATLNVVEAANLVFKTSNTEAARIDASGNLMVGKTAAGFANTGHELRGGGSYAAFTRDGGSPVLVNRKSSDGTLVEYMKDGTTVGSIGSRSGVVSYIVLDPRSGLKGAALIGGSVDANNGIINPGKADGDIADDAISLGSSSSRFKNLYLSGNASMGSLSPGVVTISSGSYFIGNATNGYRFNNAADTTNLMILKDSGDLLVGGTSQINSTKTSIYGSSSTNCLGIKNANNNNYLITALNSSNTEVFRVAGTGDVTNTNNSYGSLSDARLKSNVVDASSQLDDIMAVQVRSYTLDSTGETHIGVIAQELESSGMSGLVSEDKEGMKSVKYSVLYMKAIKAIQEQQATIEALTARIAALES